MILGIGSDIIEIERVKKQVANQSFVEKIFTKHEIEYCKSIKNNAQNFAVRFAAKEAFLKAIGIGWRDGLSFNQIGQPHVFTELKQNYSLIKNSSNNQ